MSITEAKALVHAALQAWRDSEETQGHRRTKPASYDAVIGYQARAYAAATDADWLSWAQTAQREGARMLACELAMVGRSIPNAPQA